MPTPKPSTHLVVGDGGKVLHHIPAQREISPNLAAAYEAQFRATPGNAGAVVLNLAEVDVATLARLAFADAPDLARRGSGFLGAGTHPAQPYLETMLGMRGVTATNAPGMTFGHDRVADIVNAFVGNASTWRGDTARAVKAALRTIGAKR
jgi:hypothetical protein